MLGAGVFDPDDVARLQTRVEIRDIPAGAVAQGG